MRVLGGEIHSMGSITPEVNKRLNAIKSSFHSLGSFWSTPGISFRLKRSVLLGVQSAGVQNLEAYLVTEGLCKKLDSLM
eukprot:9105236-Pyramimonas_sp.AAC.1